MHRGWPAILVTRGSVASCLITAPTSSRRTSATGPTTRRPSASWKSSEKIWTSSWRVSSDFLNRYVTTYVWKNRVIWADDLWRSKRLLFQLFYSEGSLFDTFSVVYFRQTEPSKGSYRTPISCVTSNGLPSKTLNKLYRGPLSVNRRLDYFSKFGH